MRRRGPVWHLIFAGREATVLHTKGLAEIARLLATAGNEIRVLDLVDAANRSGAPGRSPTDTRSTPTVSGSPTSTPKPTTPTATTTRTPRRAVVERQALLDELSRVTAPDDAPDSSPNHPTERARGP